MRRSRAAFVIGLALACGIAWACSTDYSVAPSSDGGTDASLDGTSTLADGSASSDGSTDVAIDARVVAFGGGSFPTGFPTHFDGVMPPPFVVDLTDLCAVDTGDASRAPTITICPMGAPPVTSTPSSLAIVDAQNAVVLFAHALHVTHAVAVTGARSLAIVSATTIEIDAPIIVSASHAVAGPGATNTGAAMKPPDPHIGSGGGGFGTAGALGGNGGLGGGNAYGDDAASFVGGSPGGDSVYTADSSNDGGECGFAGAGGGAVQISAGTSLIIGANGAIDSAGGGGYGGCLDVLSGTSAGGAGGGAGGTIFLESLGAFIVSGAITANGGGGGSGGSGTSMRVGNKGDDGYANASPADGGSPIVGTTSEGAGGSGGAAGIAPTPGGITGTHGGGGGGAVGRIWIRSKAPPTGTPTFSPAPAVLNF
jgi:hypothetical protein